MGREGGVERTLARGKASCSAVKDKVLLFEDATLRPRKRALESLRLGVPNEGASLKRSPKSYPVLRASFGRLLDDFWTTFGRLNVVENKGSEISLSVRDHSVPAVATTTAYRIG